MEFLLKQTISFQSQNLKARNSCKLNRDEEKRWVLLIIRAIIIKFTWPVGKDPGKLSSNKITKTKEVALGKQNMRAAC